MKGTRLLLMRAAAFVVAVLAVMRVDPAFACSPKWKAYVTAMKSELRNVAAAQEQHRARRGTYAADLATLEHSIVRGIQIRIVRANDSDWAAVATHTEIVGACYYVVGEVPAPFRQPPEAKGEEPWCADISAARAAGASQAIISAVAFGLIVLTFAAGLFLQERGKRNLAVKALLLTTLVYIGLVADRGSGSCSSDLPYPVIAAIGIVALALFGVALRRHLRAA